jgi:hypothetical protein
MKAASLVVASLILIATSVHAGTDPAIKCQSKKLKATGKAAASLLKCHAKAVKKGAGVDTSCLDKASEKLSKLFASAEKKVACTDPGDLGTIEPQVDALVALVVAQLPPGPSGQKCASKKLLATGKKVAGLLGSASKDVKKPDAAKFAKGVGKTEAKFAKTFDKEEGKGNCQTSGDRQFLDEDVDDFVKSILGISDPICPQQLLYSPEHNRLWRYDLDTISANPPLISEVLIPSAADDPVNGRDINGQICPFPDASGNFVTAEDTGQPTPPAGWGVFDSSGTQIGKLTATYFTNEGPEPHGCAFAPDGNLFTTEIGDQSFVGNSNGELIMWFPPLDEFPGMPGEYPATNDPSTNFCKIAVDIGTASGVAVDDDGNVYVAAARDFNVRKFSPPFPTAPNGGGGCGSTDALGSPMANVVNESIFVSDTENLGTPSSIARAPDGNWWISSNLTGRISEYDTDGHFVRRILDPPDAGGPIPLKYGHPQGLAVDCRGNLYYADLALVSNGGDIGPGPNGTVRRITFDIAGNPRLPTIIADGLAYPDALGIFPGDLETP